MMSVIDRKKPLKKRGVKSPSKAKAAGPSAKPSRVAELRHRMHLTQAVFARLIPVSLRSLATLESGKPPTDAVARRLTELRRLINALSEVINKESLGAWLQTPNEAFDGLKPLEVIDRGESDRIWSMIYFLRSGVAS
jgi:DNA-binding transcriptional regulator YiaG